MNSPSHVGFRLTTLVFALLLGLQCIWLVLAELSRPNLKGLPADGQAATAALKRRSDATWAARIGGIRGDLWAEAAFTYANLLWPGPGSDPDPTKSSVQARDALEHALEDAPHQAGAWLLLAGLAARYHWSNLNATEALKMSYYTGPSDEALMPPRLRVAAAAEAISGAELQELVRRDVRLLWARKREGAIVEAYQDASPAGKRLIEDVVGEIDPARLQSLHAGRQKP
jgi:hypothetical protein